MSDNYDKAMEDLFMESGEPTEAFWILVLDNDSDYKPYLYAMVLAYLRDVKYTEDQKQTLCSALVNFLMKHENRDIVYRLLEESAGLEKECAGNPFLEGLIVFVKSQRPIADPVQESPVVGASRLPFFEASCEYLDTDQWFSRPICRQTGLLKDQLAFSGKVGVEGESRSPPVKLPLESGIPSTKTAELLIDPVKSSIQDQYAVLAMFEALPKPKISPLLVAKAQAEQANNELELAKQAHYESARNLQYAKDRKSQADKEVDVLKKKADREERMAELKAELAVLEALQADGEA